MCAGGEVMSACLPSFEWRKVSTSSHPITEISQRCKIYNANSLSQAHRDIRLASPDCLHIQKEKHFITK